MNFALNHMVAPRLSARGLIDLAASLGCVGVELRNDLADKGLSPAPFFNGGSPKKIGEYADEKGVKILGLSEVYGFNDWGTHIEHQVDLLIEQASDCRAGSISLIPLNNGRREQTERHAMLRDALASILPKLKSADMLALVEPLGFPSSSLNTKRDATDAIDAIGSGDYFALVHDTFHHHLAGEAEFFPHETGIVHISGVVDSSRATEDMQDADRILVDGRDRLHSIDQIKALLDGGYTGAFSFEPFSPEVHRLDDVEAALRESMDHITSAVHA